MNEFSRDVLDEAFVVQGDALVEASAGTGKTYNIQNVYLRLVLQQGLTVEQILVVTFTEAATHELRERLRRMLHKGHAYLEGRLPHDDPDFERVEAIAGLEPEGKVAGDVHAERGSRIRLALMNFDNAAVFTIHGFCHRVLQRFAFECGHDPEAELAAGRAEALEAVTLDWWRRMTYADEDFRARVPFTNPAELTGYLIERLARPDAEIRPALAEEEGWSEAASSLEDAIHTFLEQARAGDAPFTSPNAAAKRLLSQWFPKLVDLLRAKDRSRVNVRSAWSAMKKDAAGAWWKRDGSKVHLADVAPDVDAGILRIRRQCLAEMAKCLEGLAGEVTEAARRRRTMTYDDLLRAVRAALRDPAVGAGLKKVLREEFRAALVDEFQDTDAVQYEIFDRLFREPEAPLLFVGDPKQAIYGFRGGDVFTYYRAKGSVSRERHYALGTNYRCEERLLSAINDLFSDGPDKTFLHDAIPYDGTLKADDISDRRALLHRGRRDAAPLRLWRYACGNSVPGAHSDSARRVYSDVADEIVRLLADPELTIDECPVRPRDIAILVCTHAEADLIHEQLEARDVHAVRQNIGNVFDAPESAELALLMEAMLHPSDARLVRGALCTSLLPCTEADLWRFARDEEAASSSPTEPGPRRPGSMGAWMEIFREAGDGWRRRSFIEAFRQLTERISLRAYLVDLEDGERKLTQVLHLAELTHQAAEHLQLGPAGLLRWFALQMNEDTREVSDDQVVRLVSDDDAVNIMTVFKSKGLEFPIVFVPTLWRREARAVRNDQKLLYFHDAAQDHQPVLSLDREDQAAKTEAAAETLQEDVRLIYVAATRAVNRVYLVEMGEEKEERYALQHILAHWRRSGRAKTGQAIEVSEGPAGDVAGMAPLPPGGTEDPKALKTYGERRRAPVVDKTHGHTSFSGLSPGGHDAVRLDLRDVDMSDNPEEKGEAEEGLGADIFSIPGGARTGDCWHAIFEHLDFAAPREEQDAVVRAELDRYGICQGPTDEVTRARRRSVHDMVQRVLNVQLGGVGKTSPFRLRGIPLSARRAEFAFHFSLDHDPAEHRTQAIVEVLRKHWGDDPGKASFIERLSSWDRTLPRGFMTGFIDLLFCHRDRFYIVDWKSNRRLGKAGDFEAAGLIDEMGRHAYFLQYLIYTVAVHGFLQQALEGYEYDRHFGGVFYLFLRGMAPSSTRGVYADRPSAALVNELAATLTGVNP